MVTTPAATAATSTCRVRRTISSASHSGPTKKANDGTVQHPTTLATAATTSDGTRPFSRCCHTAMAMTMVANPRSPSPRACRDSSSQGFDAGEHGEQQGAGEHHAAPESSTSPISGVATVATIDQIRARVGSTEPAPG